MRAVLWALVLGGMALLGGCATVAMGDAAADAAAKTFAAKPGVSKLYIYRNEGMGAAIRMPVDVDGKHIGTTAAMTYLLVEVAPGRHTVVSRTENDSRLDLDTIAGQQYFVWQEVKMGAFAARSQLQLVSEAVGRKGVLESKLAVADSGSSNTYPKASPVYAATPPGMPTASPVAQAPAAASAAPSASVPVQSPAAGARSIASGFAAIDDVDAIPYLSDKGRAGYRTYLQRGTPKAFAIAPNGSWGSANGLVPGEPGLPTDPGERALAYCARHSAECKLYAVNGSVVWVKPVPQRAP